MRVLKNKKGFTLIELLIVLVIIGVVAGLMFPVLAAQVEKSRAQEALTALGTVKEAMVKYQQTTGNNSYVGATFANIGFDPNVGAAGQVPLFSYVIGGLGANTFTCTAQREPAAANVGNTVQINQLGTVTRNGVYA